MGCAVLQPTRCPVTTPSTLNEDSEAKAVTSCRNTQKIRMEGLKMANNKQIYITSTLFFLAAQPRCCCFALSTAKDTVIKKTVQDTP